MVDDYDPYREALVLETETIWPSDCEDWEPGKKSTVAAQLHAEPAKAANLEYVRLHSGFCRRIHVTPDDLAQLNNHGLYPADVSIVKELPTIVRVALGRATYDIEIGTGNLPGVGEFVTARRKTTHAVIITDEHVQEPHANRVAASLTESGVQVDILVIEPGEASKSVAVADELWQKLLALGADRKTVVIAVGGGVTGDLAGFVAAAFARGLAFVQVPTTLLADVDSSVGGKVGVNLPNAKNMVGAFWQPLGVVIDTDTLTTLPDREYRAGLAEVVKYGVILDAAFFEWLEANAERLNRRDAEALRYAIVHSVRLKANIVERDEREETGQRAVLNYGHTFAHAIEAVHGYGELLHGEAVAIGMLCASRLAERLGRIDREITERQRRLLATLNLPTIVPDVETEELLSAMTRDKKVEHGRLRFVLPSRMGRVDLVGNIDSAEVQAVLNDGDSRGATGSGS